MRPKLILALFILVGFPVGSSALEPDRWLEDLRQYENGIRTLHIYPFSVISEGEFVAALREIEASLPKHSDAQITLDLMKLTRRIGDGHTAIHANGLHRFPLELYRVGNDWRVIGVLAEHAAVLGSKVVSIDGHPIAEVTAAVTPVTQHVDNANSEVIRLGETLVVAEILETLGLTRKKGVATFRFSGKGADARVTLRASASSGHSDGSGMARLEMAEPAIKPLSKSGKDYLWFGRPDGTQAAYVKFASYPSFDEMEAFGMELLTYINDNHLSQVIIDLRGNGGGDFFVGLALAYGLNLADSIDWKKGVFVLTDKYTFSAAVSNAAQFRQILNARIVGEPTGGNPVGYQDMGTFQLKNSGLTVAYSKRLFRMQDTDTEGVQPDILIEYDWNSYVRGVDNILARVLDSL